MMTKEVRVARAVEMTAGQPRVPEPHPADYSSPIPDATFDLIDEMFPQNELSSGRTLQRFEC